MDFSEFNELCFDDIRQLPTEKLIELKSKLKQYSTKVLTQVIQHIKNDRWTDLDNLIGYSPSGDSHGSDNEFILFSDWKVAGDCRNWQDIGSIVYALKEIDKVLDSRNDEKCKIDIFNLDLRTWDGK